MAIKTGLFLGCAADANRCTRNPIGEKWNSVEWRWIHCEHLSVQQTQIGAAERATDESEERGSSMGVPNSQLNHEPLWFRFGKRNFQRWKITRSLRCWQTTNRWRISSLYVESAKIVLLIKKEGKIEKSGISVSFMLTAVVIVWPIVVPFPYRCKSRLT